jgi:dTDP-4-amino-4,6-dideoxygalactose transaminase
MDPIMALAQDNDLFVIEDCAQAHGATYKGRSVGSIGHIGAWSFCQDKIITTGGEGGMVTTNDTELWNRMWSYKDHGKSYDAIYNQDHKDGFRWVHDSFGTNWRMTELQAVIGRIQLSRMNEWHTSRFNNAKKIWDAANQSQHAWAPELPDYIEHAAYKAYIFTSPEKRNYAIEQINSMSVPCYSGTCSEVYLEKAFDATSFRPVKRLKNAKALGETSLMFLVHPTLTEQELNATCKAIKDVFN